MTVSAIASGIYQAAKTAAYLYSWNAAPEWNWRLEWSKAMKKAYNIFHGPQEGIYYSAYEDFIGSDYVGKLVNEDKEYWYFSNNTKHSKDIPFDRYIIKEDAIKEAKEEKEVQYEYPDFAMHLAATYTIQELRSKLQKLESLTEQYTAEHLRAVEATTSMQSNSQRRAQAGNKVRANYESKQMYRWAIEIKEIRLQTKTARSQSW